MVASFSVFYGVSKKIFRIYNIQVSIQVSTNIQVKKIDDLINIELFSKTYLIHIST